MPESQRTEKYAFEPFGTLAGVLTGQPFRIFPVGTYHRGARKLEITPARLQEFATNVKAGLPKFRIPINVEHDATLGKHGEIADVEFMPNGPDGAGLYATKYELTDAGRKWLEEGKADAVSGEAVWTLNDNAKYQDPTTGKLHDNVLVGVALTATPFFGNEVNLFSAGEQFYDPNQPRDDRGRWGDGGGGGEGGAINRGAVSKLPKPSSREISIPRDKKGNVKLSADQSEFIANMVPVNVPYEGGTPSGYEINMYGQNGYYDAAYGSTVYASNQLGAVAKGSDGNFYANGPGGRVVRATNYYPINWFPGDRPPAGYTDGTPVDSFTTDEPAPRRHNGYTKMRDALREMLANFDHWLRDDDNDGIPDAEQPHPPAPTMESAPALHTAQTDQGVETMEDEKNKAAPEQMTAPVSVDEFNALKAQLETTAKQAETFAAQLAAERRTRRLGEITARVQTFAYVTGESLAEHLMALEEKAPDEAAYFTGLLETLDTQAAQAALFAQHGSPRRNATQVETLEDLAAKIVADKFDGNTAKYSDALTLAGKQRPDLLRAYITGAPADKE